MPTHERATTATADATATASRWKPFEDRRRDRDTKRAAVLRVAVNLFLEQGYDRTSLNEVAERLNITKPALYNYFDGKEDILLECHRLGREMVMAGIEDILARPGDGLSRLRALIHHYVEMMTQDFSQCLVRIDDRVLSEPARKQVRAAKRGIDTHFRAFLAEGIRDGSIKPCDVRVTAFAIAGSINWIGYWYRADGEMNPKQLGDAYARLLTDGLTTPAN